jgi:hypothetical protein
MRHEQKDPEEPDEEESLHRRVLRRAVTGVNRYG